MSPFAVMPLPGHRTARPTIALAFALLGASVFPGQPATAASDGPVGLGTAASFAVLAGSGITNTGPTRITGDVGTFPTTSRTGFASVTLIGTDHGGDAVTQGAKDALVTTYDDAFGRTPATSVPVELGGSTLPAGVYTSPTFGLTGTLTLDAEGRADAEFVFQAGSTLIAEVNSRIVLVNGADPCHVVWQVGSSATFKTGTRFAGDVLAYTSITAQRSATFRGRLLARNGAVTLDTNVISNATCAVAVPDATSSPTAGSTSALVPPILPAAVPPAANPVLPPGGPATGVAPPPSVPGTPVRTAGGPPGLPFLPDTGSGSRLAIIGLVLLALGSVMRLRGRRTAAP